MKRKEIKVDETLFRIKIFRIKLYRTHIYITYIYNLYYMLNKSKEVKLKIIIAAD